MGGIGVAEGSAVRIVLISAVATMVRVLVAVDEIRGVGLAAFVTPVLAGAQPLLIPHSTDRVTGTRTLAQLATEGPHA